MESIERDEVVRVLANRVAACTDDWRWARNNTARVNELWETAKALGLSRALEDELYLREGGPE